MRYRMPAFFTLCGMILASLTLGCSATSNPSAPATPQAEASPAAHISDLGGEGGSTRHLWGLYDITIDPWTLEVEIVPLRQADFTCNVTGFLQPPWSPKGLLGLYIDPAESDLDNGLVVCDVTLQHPFPGLPMYRGFDVRGIVMGHGNLALSHDPSALYAGLDDLMLLNADGHTRWWNPTEFGPHGTIFGYVHGALVPRSYVPTATLNGYKYFADELGSDDDLALDPADRGVFSNNPGVNTRRYEIQFPIVGEEPVYNFAYAIGASWEPPDPGGAPGYPISSFSPQANCAESYLITVTDAGSTAWFADESDKGGCLMLEIEIFDWQAPHNPLGVPGELAGLWFESELVSEPVDILAGANILPGGSTSSVFEVQIVGLNLTRSGPHEAWVIAESADPDTYEPQIPEPTSPWTWSSAPLAAYLCTSVEISGVRPQNAPVVLGIDPYEGVIDLSLSVTVTGQNFADGCEVELRESESFGWFVIEGQDEIRTDDTEVACTVDLTSAPDGLYDVVVINPGFVEGELEEGFEVKAVGVIYVDDSNSNGPEDGTMEHPFDSIQDGIDDAGLGYEVWVDDSGNPYLGQVVMTDGVPLKSVNWDESDGDDEATIAVTNGTDVCVVGADDTSIEGFEINGNHSFWHSQCGIECDGVSMDIIDCRVVDFHNEDARAIWLHNGSHSLIEGVDISDINNNTWPGYSTFYGILVENCDAVGDQRVVIKHTIVRDVFSSGLYDGLNCNVHGIMIYSSDGAQVINSTVHDVTGGSGHQVYGIRVVDSADVELTNIVIYHVEKTYYYGTASGLTFSGCTDLDVRNAIITFIRKNWPPQMAYGVWGSGSTYSLEYNDVYDCSTELYYGVTPGTGGISFDPLFVNPGNDFHLDTGSLCIDSGDPSIFDPDESISDMGAYGGPGADW